MSKMTYIQFREIVASIPDCPDFESFVHERGWQEWMEAYDGKDGSADEIVRVLQLIWTLRDNPIKAISAASGKSCVELSEEYRISQSTMKKWSAKISACPDYTWMMLAYCVFGDCGLI